jgi:GTP-binding protein
MPRTKFVLTKALKLNLKPIVVVNKIDRPDARIDEVINEIFDLFVALDATSEQLDFPIVYASGRAGIAKMKLEDTNQNITPLFETIISHVSAPKTDSSSPFAMSVTMREYNSYLGRVLTGRIYAGTLNVNQSVKVLDRNGKILENGRVVKILAFSGLERVPVETALAGDIITVSGLKEAGVGDTICSPEVNESIPSLPIDPPTMTIRFSINDSPLAGMDGNKLTSNVLGERLKRETESNVALSVAESEEKDSFEVAGRGELQLGILIETMRREGFELSIGRPRVLYKTDEEGRTLEPMEEIQVDVDDEFVGTVVKSLSERKVQTREMRALGAGKTRVTLYGPSRGLIGYYGKFLTETRGSGVMNRTFVDYAPHKGSIEGTRNGVLISSEAGTISAYALWNLEDRGRMFVNPGEQTYKGMIIGEHNRDNDLEVNPTKAKQLSNVRAAGKDEAIRLMPPMAMTLERAISYIADDEQVEVTPKHIRLRKIMLDSNERKRFARVGKI